VSTDKRQRQKQGQHARKTAALAAARRRQRKQRMILSVVLAALVVGFVAIAASQGGGKDDADTADGGTTTSTTEASTTPTSAKPADVEPGTGKVAELKIEDLKVGDGPEVKVGDTIVAHYLGATYADGKTFQASWDSGSTFETVIGQGAVIQGWDEGIPGMKVGGRRKLTIPAEMAYGAEDKGDGSPFGDLVFIVDVYAVK
jgi:peptidylprolyl isomerase